MAGAYNHNVLKEAKRLCDEAEQYKIFAIGETGRAYFSSLGYNVENSFRFSANNPSVHRARVITEDIVERYKKEEMDEVYIVYTKMEHGMKEEVQVEQLLPLKTNEFIKEELAANARTGKDVTVHLRILKVMMIISLSIHLQRLFLMILHIIMLQVSCMELLLRLCNRGERPYGCHAGSYR